MEPVRIEGLWDCAFCGQKGIRARYDRCQGCGSPRGTDTVFYLPTDIAAATLTKEEAAKTSNAPDWLCDYCGSLNSADFSVCKGCGSKKEEATKNYGSLHASASIPDAPAGAENAALKTGRKSFFGRLADLIQK